MRQSRVRRLGMRVPVTLRLRFGARERVSAEEKEYGRVRLKM